MLGRPLPVSRLALPLSRSIRVKEREMWKSAAGGGGGGVMMLARRYLSRKSEPRNLRKIDPKVAQEEATSIAETLYNLIKQHGPLTVSNTWNHAQEAGGISGLNSKTHMKLMLKWMRGRNMLKLFCNQVGSSKKFLHCTLPEDPQSDQSKKLMELKLHSEKFSPKRKKQMH